MAPDIIERLKASAYIASALSIALLPFTHASPSKQLGRRSGGRPQRTVDPRRLPVNTV